MEPLIAWQAPEHRIAPKTSDWYWAVGIIVFTGAALAFIFGQVIFGILIIVAAVALVLHASAPARDIRAEVSDRGIVVGKTFYPFLHLDSFWIDPHEFPSQILLKSARPFMPYIRVPIADDIEAEEVRQILLRYIAEAEHEEPLTLKLMERLGF